MTIITLGFSAKPLPETALGTATLSPSMALQVLKWVPQGSTRFANGPLHIAIQNNMDSHAAGTQIMFMTG